MSSSASVRPALGALNADIVGVGGGGGGGGGGGQPGGGGGGGGANAHGTEISTYELHSQFSKQKSGLVSLTNLDNAAPNFHIF